MLSSGLKWVGRIVIVGTVIALVRRALGSRRSGKEGASIPSVSGDTWPPVPANPERHD